MDVTLATPGVPRAANGVSRSVLMNHALVAGNRLPRLIPGGPAGVAAVEFDDVVAGAAQGAGRDGIADATLAVAHNSSL